MQIDTQNTTQFTRQGEIDVFVERHRGDPRDRNVFALYENVPEWPSKYYFYVAPTNKNLTALELCARLRFDRLAHAQAMLVAGSGNFSDVTIEIFDDSGHSQEELVSLLADAFLHPKMNEYRNAILSHNGEPLLTCSTIEQLIRRFAKLVV